MAVTTTELISDVRLQCDVVDDPQVGDAEIAGYLSDGLRCLYDIFQDVFPLWNMSRLSFTLAGNTQLTNFALLPDDFQSEVGLNWTNPPGVAGPVTVPRLGTWQDRNRGNVYASPVAPQGLFMRREYVAQADRLIVLPYFQSSGDYVLDYIPQVAALAEPVVIASAPYSRAPAHNAGDGSNAGSELNIVNAAFTSADLGATIVISGSANALDGTYAVATIVDGDTVTTSPAITPSLSAGVATVITITQRSVQAATGVWTFSAIATPPAVGDTLVVSGSASNDGSYAITAVGARTLTTATTGLVNETFGAGVSVAWQAAGTLASLPLNLTPWRLYVISFAGISVKTKREEDTTALQVRLNQESVRARKSAELRSQQTIKQIQVPGGPGLGFGGGGDWTNGTDGDWWW